ncbi:hypothetical protein BM526_20245 (plasmid) [Alteromonas mediterranea]|uniref:DotA/TraY family protein n=1 Tax=Alteromonas mediterranea TaxID=314275 RepID=UPI0009043D34|nr:DotA/TraY family protein [Alteromonas mediterranea]APE04305.1 hypothetical protein BM526_20245 [Alteromonas mediterranea]
MRNFDLFVRSLVFPLLLVMSLFTFQDAYADDTTTGMTNEDMLNDMQHKVEQLLPADSAYEISGAQLLGGPGPDDVAAHMAYLAFGHPVKAVMDSRFSGINVTSPGDENITLITHMGTITASLAIFFTSLMLFAALFGGIIYTGKDGELLGKDWDHKLFPLRASWHTAFLIPWPGFGGLAGIQVIILFLGLLGLGIGGVVFTSGVKFISNGEQIVSYQSRDINALAEKIMESAMCDAVNAQFTANYTSSAQIVNLTRNRGRNVPPQIVGRQFVVGANGECGRYEINYLPPELVDSELRAAREAGNVDNLHSDVIKSALFSVVDGENGAIMNFFSQVKAALELDGGVAYRFANLQESEGVEYRELKDDEMESLEAARETFYNTLVSAISPSSNADLRAKMQALNASFVDEASRFGFAFFFKYYYELSSRQEVTSSAVASFLDADDSYNISWDIDYCPGFFENLFGTCDDVENSIIIRKRIESSFYDMYDKYNIMYSNALGAMVDGQTYSNSVIENFTFKAVQAITEIPRDINPDPIVEVKWLGDTLTTAADAIFLFSAKVKAAAYGAEQASGALPLAGIVPAALSSYVASITSKLWVALIPLFGLAFAYAYIIPSIPVIFGFVAVFSYFIYWTLALYHSPFWYAMGVMPKGDGLMGRANTGYSMAVNLLLMPAFMIIGYFSGMALMKVFGWFVSISFFDAMADVNRAGGLNDFSLSKIVGLFVVYGTIYTVLIWKCFGMIFETSNTLSQWMGTNNKTDFGESEAKTTALTSSGIAGQKFSESALHMKREGDRDEKEAKRGLSASQQGKPSDKTKRQSTSDIEKDAKNS